MVCIILVNPIRYCRSSLSHHQHWAVQRFGFRSCQNQSKVHAARILVVCVRSSDRRTDRTILSHSVKSLLLYQEIFHEEAVRRVVSRSFLISLSPVYSSSFLRLNPNPSDIFQGSNIAWPADRSNPNAISFLAHSRISITQRLWVHIWRCARQSTTLLDGLIGDIQLLRSNKQVF